MHPWNRQIEKARVEPGTKDHDAHDANKEHSYAAINNQEESNHLVLLKIQVLCKSVINLVTK